MSQLRQYFYLFAGLISSVVPILITLGILEPDTGSQWLAIVAALSGILGTGGSLTAAAVITKQRGDPGHSIGTSPADQIINNLPKVAERVTNATNDLERVKSAIGQSLEGIPILGPLAKEALRSLDFE